MNNLWMLIFCVTCNRPLQKAISASLTEIEMLQLFIPFILLGLLTAFVGYKALAFKNKPQALLSQSPLVAAACVLGIGLGGFIDGIVFHQILQWHEMVSAKIIPLDFTSKSINMFWDGIFHAFTLLITFFGILLLYKLLQQNQVLKHRNLFIGGLLMGWGLFNLIEGLFNHHVFKFHTVKDFDLNPQIWNISFLAFSILIIVLGYFLIYKIKNIHHENWRTNS
ncbi:DUF2243 domain-containing protein [Pedobacter aquae]|uniref:DUF2243 domain-containing protein n=1 Tax=Pedobacter aquae TaxID=2605747 RepID=A0A5C0VF26_9SPHI|nr:DUF2243 domain-containing protein [Pedobacter aquae]QEK51318.1 DUF2243 domain-containing protein [Pedobacter aquae]